MSARPHVLPRPSRLALALPLAAALGLAAPARAQTPLDEVLPGSTRAALLVQDLAQYKERLGESSFGRMMADPALAGVRARLAASWARLGEESAAATGVDVAALLELVEGEVAWGLLAVDHDADTHQFRAVAAGLIEVGPEIETFAADVDRLAEWAAEELGFVLKSESLAGVDVGVLVAEEAEAELRYAVEGETLVIVANHQALPGDVPLEDLLLGVRGEADDVLADAPGFRGSLAGGQGHAMRAWLDLGRLVQFVERLVADGSPDAPSPELLHRLGVDRLAHAALTADHGAGGTNSSAEIVFGEVAGAIPRVLEACSAGGAPALLAAMPPSAKTAVAVHVDLAGIYDAVLAEIAAHDPEALRAAVAGMAEAQAATGFHVRDDLLENLDGQIGFLAAEVAPEERFVFFPPDADDLNFALLLGLRDGAAFRTVVDAAVRKQGAHAARRREEFEGLEVYFVPGPMGFNLGYCVTDDLFVMSFSPSLLKDVLRRRLSPDLASVVTQPGYDAARGRLPPRADALSSEPGKASGRAFLELLVAVQDGSFDAMLGQLGVLGKPLSVSGWLVGIELPDLSLVDKYYEGPSLTAISVGGRGLRMDSVAP